MGSAYLRYDKKRAIVKGLSMAYVESGEGDPIVFLHGNPTSSFLWRDVIPHVENLGRCIAPDLIGMGDSDKVPDSGPDSYDFFEHREYLDALLEELGVSENVVLVVHDWGSGLGFDWAFRHQDRLKGIVHMESIVKSPRWADQDEQVTQMFLALRSEAGDEMVLQQNMFVEMVLPSMVMGTLSEEVMTEYRRPFLEPGESRRPMLSWPRQIPFDGEPKAVHKIIERYSKWLPGSQVPKLYIDAKPGLIGGQKGMREWIGRFYNQRVVPVSGLHFIQEDIPHEIGDTIANGSQTWSD